MLRIAICDDENSYLDYEKELIETYMLDNDIEYELFEFVSGIDLLESYNKSLQYDVIFLDIDMKTMNGIETAKRIRKMDSKVFLVYVTAYNHYTLEGYMTKTFRYILKDADVIDTLMEECLDAIMYETNHARKIIPFKFVEGNVQVTPEDIIYIESIKHKVCYKIIRGENIEIFTTYGKLDEAEKILEGCGFCRIHKSFLVNLRYVKDLQKKHLELKDGTLLNVARSKYEKTGNDILNFWGELWN